MNSTLTDAQMNPALLPLTPGMLSDSELRAYEQEFNLVFSNPDLRNIAISGATGAGKSTVMNSWKARHPEHNWLTVSLASFAREQDSLNSTDIEEALINQIVGQMDLSRSPKTRFRKSMERPKWIDLGYGLIGAAFIALTIFLIWIASLIPSMRPAQPLCVLAIVAWFACIVFAIYRIARTNAISRAIKKLHIASNEIELASGEGSSPLERYMPDLVYLLDTGGYDTVIFDDLDSFDYAPLFRKLRELSALANAKRTDGRVPLRFFYLVNDGFFIDPHDRAKFFDYIITVIPYIDPSNALALFREGLEGVGIVADDEFLYELSLFIDDPRILRDLVNEAHHYRESLFAQGDTQPGDIERLIAILAYKTLFPRDFEFLQVDQGYVNALLKSRPIIIDQLTAQNSREIEALAAEIDEDDATSPRNEALRMRIDEVESENLAYSRQTLAQLLAGLEDSEAIFADPPYRQGLERIYLSEVLASPHFPLIQFLIMREWIDDTHDRFMSNFYEEASSVRDREFMMSLLQGKPIDPSYRVENPASTIARLDADTLSWTNAKNYSLLSYLLEHGPEDKVRALFSGIRHDGNLDWLVGYTESEQFDSKVFAEMERQLAAPIAQILSDDSIQLARRRRFAHRILAFAPEVLEDARVRDAVAGFAQDDLAFLQVEATKPMNIADGLKTIGYHPSDLYTDGCSKKLLQYIFDNDLYEPTAPLIDSVTAAVLETTSAIAKGFLVTRLFNLGDTPICRVVAENADMFVQTLIESSDGPLTDSGEAVAWLLNFEKLSDEAGRSYIAALGNNVLIEDINIIVKPEYQAELLDQGHVADTSANILDYFKACGFTVDEHLAAFMNENPFPTDLDMGKAEGYLGDESGFLTAVIRNPDVSDDRLADIVQVYRAQFHHFGVEGLTDERMELLIKLGIVRATRDNLEFVRVHNPQSAKFFAEADIEGYLGLVLPEPVEETDQVPEGGWVLSGMQEVVTMPASAPCEFVEAEVLQIFDLETVDERAKIDLLTGFSGPVSMQPNYPHALNAAIAATHFDEADLAGITELYVKGDRKLRRALAEAVVEHRDAFARLGLSLSMDMVSDIAWRLRANREDMLGFIASQLAGRMPVPSRLEVRTVFERANLREYVELIDGPSAIIPESPEDDELLAALESIGMAGKQTGKVDWQGARRINSKGYTRK